MLAAAFALIAARSAFLLAHGRVVFEEGTVYLRYAWYDSVPYALIADHQGYYSLFMNVLGILTARVFPLEWASFVFTYAACAVMLWTVFLAIECERFDSARLRLLAAAICLLAPSIEVWMVAEDSQFYLVICTALIALSSTKRLRAVRLLTLLAAGLTGPVSCCMAPFFWWKAWQQRNWTATAQAILLTLCALLQASLILHFRHPSTGNGRFAWFGPVIFMKIIAPGFFTRLGAFAAQRVVVHHGSLLVCALFWGLSLAGLGLFFRQARIAGSAGVLCFCMALASLLFNYTGIAEPVEVIFIGAFRYFFTGTVLLWLTLLLAYAAARTPREQRFAGALVALVLFCGSVDAIGYWKRLQGVSPLWTKQVRAWRQDPNLRIDVLGAGGPSFYLKPQHGEGHFRGSTELPDQP